jgi:hypothetical protein
MLQLASALTAHFCPVRAELAWIDRQQQLRRFGEFSVGVLCSAGLAAQTLAQTRVAGAVGVGRAQGSLQHEDSILLSCVAQ